MNQLNTISTMYWVRNCDICDALIVKISFLDGTMVHYFLCDILHEYQYSWNCFTNVKMYLNQIVGTLRHSKNNPWRYKYDPTHRVLFFCTCNMTKYISTFICIRLAKMCCTHIRYNLFIIGCFEDHALSRFFKLLKSRVKTCSVRLVYIVW